MCWRKKEVLRTSLPPFHFPLHGEPGIPDAWTAAWRFRSIEYRVSGPAGGIPYLVWNDCCLRADFLMEHESNNTPQEDPQLLGDIAIESFKAARSDIADRIKLREQTIAAYLTGVIGIVGFVLSRDLTKTGLHARDLLLFVPAIAFAAAKVLADNHDVVSALALYQAVDLGDFLTPSEQPRLGERSRFLHKPDYYQMPAHAPLGSSFDSSIYLQQPTLLQSSRRPLAHSPYM